MTAERAGPAAAWTGLHADAHAEASGGTDRQHRAAVARRSVCALRLRGGVLRRVPREHRPVPVPGETMLLAGCCARELGRCGSTWVILDRHPRRHARRQPGFLHWPARWTRIAERHGWRIGFTKARLAEFDRFFAKPRAADGVHRAVHHRTPRRRRDPGGWQRDALADVHLLQRQRGDRVVHRHRGSFGYFSGTKLGHTREVDRAHQPDWACHRRDWHSRGGGARRREQTA